MRSVCVRPPERPVSEAASPAPNVSTAHLSLSTSFHFCLRLIFGTRLGPSILFDPFLLSVLLGGFLFHRRTATAPMFFVSSIFPAPGGRKHNHEPCSFFPPNICLIPEFVIHALISSVPSEGSMSAGAVCREFGSTSAACSEHFDFFPHAFSLLPLAFRLFYL